MTSSISSLHGISRCVVHFIINNNNETPANEDMCSGQAGNQLFIHFK